MIHNFTALQDKYPNTSTCGEKTSTHFVVDEDVKRDVELDGGWLVEVVVEDARLEDVADPEADFAVLVETALALVPEETEPVGEAVIHDHVLTHVVRDVVVV